MRDVASCSRYGNRMCAVGIDVNILYGDCSVYPKGVYVSWKTSRPTGGLSKDAPSTFYRYRVGGYSDDGRSGVRST